MRKRMSMDIKDIGCRIRHARRMADLTQKQLAEVIGTTPQYLSSLERGNIGTSIGTLMNICRTLNVSADYILFAEKNSVRISDGLAGTTAPAV